MQLENLVKQLEDGGQSLSHARQEQAQVSLKQGLALLQQAHREAFSRLELLSQAAEALIKAIQSNRSLPEPYLAMAYLFVLLENHEAARSYLKELLRLDPEHAEANSLLKEMTTLATAKPATGAVIMNQPPVLKTSAGRLVPQRPADIDYDGLYDQLEVLIIQEVKKVSSIPPIQPHPSKAVLNDLTRYYEEIAGTLATIMAQLKIVEQEIETQELKSHLRPIEIVHNRFAVSIAISKQLQALLERLGGERQLVQEQLQSIPDIESREDYAIMEENLEMLLDDADQIANEINGLEKKGYPCKEAEQIYASLIQDIERLQESLDEKSPTPKQNSCAIFPSPIIYQLKGA